MSAFTLLSHELSADERTLRRAAIDGMFRVRWVSPRRAELAPGELGYLRRNGRLLFELRRALRTEPNVRLAVLFGSVARGDDVPESDIDLVVDLHDEHRGRVMDIEERLSAALGRRVGLLRLRDAQSDPALLAEVLNDGRPIVDRRRQWPSLRRKAGRLRSQGDRVLSERAARALSRAGDLAVAE